LLRYCTRILIITSRHVFYEFKMGNKMKFWVLKPNYGSLGTKPPETIGGLGASPLVFVVF